MKHKIFICSKHPKKEKQVSDKKKEEMREVSDRKKRLDAWYLYIHEKFDYVCQETGRKLKFSKKQAAHLLPKSKFPYLETDIDGGILVSWNIHDIIDKGSAKQRLELKIWSRLREERIKLLDKVGMPYSEEHWLNSKY